MGREGSRWRDNAAPVGMCRLEQRAKGVKPERLDDVGIGARGVCGFDIRFLAGPGEEKNNELSEFIAAANPSRDFEAIHFGHFQIEEEDGGERILAAVGKRAGAFQIAGDLLAIGQEDDGIEEADSLEGQLEDFAVFLTVIGISENVLRLHGKNAEECKGR